jgi:hypothetical protein
MNRASTWDKLVGWWHGVTDVVAGLFEAFATLLLMLAGAAGVGLALMFVLTLIWRTIGWLD